jgi:DeoR/GlpR family transcriptional regulator of sugar metabolism
VSESAKNFATTEGREPAGIRRRRILAMLSESEFARPVDIAAELGVSGETIRRDLVELEKSGALRRFHGAAIASSEPSRQDRHVAAREQKREIASIVASLVGPDDTLFMDVGTTIELAAEALPAQFEGTVITNSLAVAGILNDRREVEVYMLGGRARVGEMSVHGSDAVAQIMLYHAAIAFIGSGGVGIDSGITDYSVEDIAIKQAMIRNSGRSYVLATSDKFSITARRTVCELDDVDGVITDGGLADTARRAFAEAGLNVITSSDPRHR